MKLHFEDSLDFQQKAVSAVVDLFKGQEISKSEFSVLAQTDTSPQLSLGIAETDLGIGNRLNLLDEELLENLRKIQLRNGLRPSDNLHSGDFTVEMETGTGKTYVYLRTIFALNRDYGFTKFIIVVPSVAIKEGTYKTLEITREHFEGLYPKAKGYEYFLYDSTKLGLVRNFATSSTIQIMVTTVGAINKKTVNNLYKENENTGGEKPIDLLRATNPIIIVDEPQSVDGGLDGKGKKALSLMNPLCTLRYSATHTDKHHMIYRLDAVDAYEQGLVKQIEVASAEIEGTNNKPFVKLISTHNRRGTITAKVELDIQQGKKIKRRVLTVEDGDDLEQLTHRSLYENMLIGTINCRKGNESIELKSPSLDRLLQYGDEYGGVDQDALKRLMIRRTIKEHLDKELFFAANGQHIKVLSLFFIDRVDNYRQYDQEGHSVKGKYALMFEEEYQRLAQSTTYQSLFNEINIATDAVDVHQGYFSIDKKGAYATLARGTKGQLLASNNDNLERAYNLIMKDKEKLLSFDTKLKFIFSHSALKEGWDNPNVFQICNFSTTQTERWRRQTIGRGLRLCVNQQGVRVKDRDINTLTVIATESYEQFADALQRDIEADLNITFGVVEGHQFANLSVYGVHGNKQPMGVAQSETILAYLKQQGYVNAKGKIQDTLRTCLKDGSFVLPEAFHDQHHEIVAILKKLAGKLNIKDADTRKTIQTREAILYSADFKALWDRVKYKTTYRVQFDNEALIRKAAEAFEKSTPITKTRLYFRKANLEIGKGGVSTNNETISARTTIEENDIELPDLITELQDRTHLTRSSVVKILIQSRRLEDFKRNPQEFIDLAAEAINRTKRLILVDGIKYTHIGDDHYYAQELFEQKELKGYLENTLEAQKSVYTHIVYDSKGVERNFAQALENNESVKVYAKLPAWFKIATPLGSYNPDWAVLVEDDETEKLYFVVETKSSQWGDDLRYQENGKINCAEEHFKALTEKNGDEKSASYIKASTLDDMMKHID